MSSLPLHFPRSLIWLLFAFFAILPAGAEQALEHPPFSELFKQYGVTGTFAVFDLRSGALTVHNAERAAKRYIPASTFKIPNSLIALETGTVKSVEEVVPYGGGKQFLPQWEHDMPLREAFRISAVPIYKQVARRAGLERMQDWVRRLDYGNEEIGTVVDQFWLEGPLTISAIEQTHFLARLARGELPVKPATLAAVKDISRVESWENGALHAKTGWGMASKPGVGWWVGWIEQEGKPVATFALNIDIHIDADATKRIPLARACLAEQGLLARERKE